MRGPFLEKPRMLVNFPENRKNEEIEKWLFGKNEKKEKPRRLTEARGGSTFQEFRKKSIKINKNWQISEKSKKWKNGKLIFWKFATFPKNIEKGKWTKNYKKWKKGGRALRARPPFFDFLNFSGASLFQFFGIVTISRKSIFHFFIFSIFFGSSSIFIDFCWFWLSHQWMVDLM